LLRLVKCISNVLYKSNSCVDIDISYFLLKSVFLQFQWLSFKMVGLCMQWWASKAGINYELVYVVELFFQQYLWLHARLHSWQSWVSCFSFFIRICHFSLGSYVPGTFCFTFIYTIFLNILTSSFIPLTAFHMCLLLFNLQPLLLLALHHALTLSLTIWFTLTQYLHMLPVAVSGNWQCILNPSTQRIFLYILCMCFCLVILLVSLEHTSVFAVWLKFSLL